MPLSTTALTGGGTTHCTTEREKNKTAAGEEAQNAQEVIHR